MPFEREHRYIVIKINDLRGESIQKQEVLLRAIEGLTLPIRECVVVESDWPEYEEVWRMIEARVLREQVRKVAQSNELTEIHAVIMDMGGDWPEISSDPYTLCHVKRMARELQVAQRTKGEQS